MGEFSGVLLIVVRIVAINRIWLVAVYGIEEESNSTWYHLLLKLCELLRVDNGEGFCFMSHGGNSVKEALKALMCKVEIGIYVQTVYE